jgi:hypothetical protein
VDVVYTHARAGRVPVPMRDGDAALELAGLQVRLAADEVPGVLTEAGDERTALRNMLMNQFAGLDKVDHVLVNSFHDLEPQVSTPRPRPPSRILHTQILRTRRQMATCISRAAVSCC